MLALETERLRMIPLSLEYMKLALHDRASLALLCGARVPDDWPGPDLEEALSSILKNQELSAKWAAWNGMIIHKADNVVIGSMGLSAGPDRAGVAEAGYGIIPAYRNCGYATEMLRGLITWAFRENGISMVIAECLADNIGSIRVLEKAGFQRTGQDGNILKWKIEKKER